MEINFIAFCNFLHLKSPSHQSFKMLSDVLTIGLYDLPWSRIAIFTALFFLLERIATNTLLYASRPRNMKIAGLPLWPGK
jgi:hypothetical protein